MPLMSSAWKVSPNVWKSSRSSGGVRQRRALAACALSGRGCSSVARARLRAAFDRVHAAVEDVSGLRGVEAQTSRSTSAARCRGREVLERRDERQLEWFPGLVARIRPGLGVGDSLRPERPGRGRARAGSPMRVGSGVSNGSSSAGGWSAPGVPERVQTAIRRDPVQPGAQRRTLLEALETAPGCEQRFLEHVLSVLHRAEDPIAVHLELAPVGVYELAKRLLVAESCTRQQGLAYHVYVLACPVVLSPPSRLMTPNATERSRGPWKPSRRISLRSRATPSHPSWCLNEQRKENRDGKDR